MILERWSCNRKTKRWSACLRTELIFSLTPLYAFWRVGGTTTFLYCGMCHPRLRIAFQMLLKPLAQLIALHFPARTSKNQIYDHTRKNFVSVQHKEISFCNTLGTCWDAPPPPSQTHELIAYECFVSIIRTFFPTHSVGDVFHPYALK